MKGVWQWDTLNIRDETGAFVVGNCCSIEREMELIVNAHNEALRAAVEEEREGCLMDVLGELESRGFYSMASRVRAVIHARMEKPSSG